ncbi:MAG: UTP--glucose-1-phosphate uridylyltransferase, partial [Polaromonas sp.]
QRFSQRSMGLPLGSGAIQLTDAIAAQIPTSGVHVFRFQGQRFDCGSKAGFLQAIIAFGLARADLRDNLQAFLHELMDVNASA